MSWFYGLGVLYGNHKYAVMIGWLSINDKNYIYIIRYFSLVGCSLPAMA
jgi:hypothetical protein